MLVIPATAPLHRLCRITLVCSDRDDIPARVTATCARRCGVVLALTFARGRPGDTADGTPGTGPPTGPAGDGVPATATATATAGADVRQFEKNLKALGYNGFTVDGRYTRATATAVRRWQERLGLAETGSVKVGTTETTVKVPAVIVEKPGRNQAEPVTDNAQ